MFPSKAVFPNHMRTTALYIDWSETLLYIIHYGHEDISFYRNLRITGITDTTLWDRMIKCKSVEITSGDWGKPGNSQNVLQPEGAAVLTLLLSVNARTEF